MHSAELIANSVFNLAPALFGFMFHLAVTIFMQYRNWNYFIFHKYSCAPFGNPLKRDLSQALFADFSWCRAHFVLQKSVGRKSGIWTARRYAIKILTFFNFQALHLFLLVGLDVRCILLLILYSTKLTCCVQCAKQKRRVPVHCKRDKRNHSKFATERFFLGSIWTIRTISWKPEFQPLLINLK